MAKLDHVKSAEAGLKTKDGGKPVSAMGSLPMKEPVGPNRTGKATTHGTCGTQRKG